MNQIQSTTKRFAVRTFAMFVVMSVALTPLASAQTQSVGGTVATVNTLSITAGNTLALTPTVATAAVDTTTALAFETNDGVTYKVTVAAAIWTFTPSVTSMPANTWPVLRFVSATSTAGTASTTAGELISASNTAGTTVNVVTAITSAKGTAAVTLDASITQTVVSGSYATTLTYALVTP